MFIILTYYLKGDFMEKDIQESVLELIPEWWDNGKNLGEIAEAILMSAGEVEKMLSVLFNNGKIETIRCASSPTLYRRTKPQ